MIYTIQLKQITCQDEGRIKPCAVSLAVDYMMLTACRFKLKYNNENRS